MPQTRRSSRLQAKELARQQEVEAALAAEAAARAANSSQTAGRSPRRSKRSTKEEMDGHSQEAFRHSVRSMLDSPNNLPKKKVAPSPRLDRITITNQNDEMEFLIPPKRTSEPLEIREQIRSVLSFSEPATSGKSKLDVPMKDGATGLWSPAAPGHDFEKDERISRWLIGTIFTILTAVFVSYYHREIGQGAQDAFAQMMEFGGQFVEWLTGMASTAWEAMPAVFSKEGGVVDVDVSQMDDSVTR